MKYSKNGGYSLIEVLIAITVLLLAVGGPMTIASKGLQSTYLARDQLIASMLAQEQIEAIIAIRNDAVIDEINGGSFDLSTANIWDTWADPNGALDACFTNDGDDGCNINFVDENPIDNIVSCNTLSNCQLRLTPGETRAKYQTGGTGDLTPFTRVTELSETTSGVETLVTVTVEWTPIVFGGASTQVVVTSSVFNIYGL